MGKQVDLQNEVVAMLIDDLSAMQAKVAEARTWHDKIDLDYDKIVQGVVDMVAPSSIAEALDLDYSIIVRGVADLVSPGSIVKP